MIPMTPGSPACYREVEGMGEEGSYWPSSVSPGVVQSTSGDEGTGGAKVRKPYTITKQRERWTEEEHQKFLEALKLYGRAWRRIEEHIGTKTAVQIRSHAQKFFSKIERDVTAGQGAETGVAQVIDIPPPRPKRKPTHPYPRKAGRSFGKTPEDENMLAPAGSISSSSGISTANVTEGNCSKSGSSAWEQDDSGDASHHHHPDAAKWSKDADGARAWGMPKPVITPADGGSSSPAPNLGPPLMNHSPVPIPAFPGAMPWARMFGGGMNPAMVNPAMMNPAMMNPQGMMMPWGVAPNAQGGLENGSAVSAMAATIAAASAWWAMQGGMPPGLMHPALGAMYTAAGGAVPPLAIPTPFLFPQCAPHEPAAVAVPCGADGKDVVPPHGVVVGDDGQKTPSCNNGSSRSSTMRRKRAERAQRVKELKARRMGSGNHLLSVSSDVCASTSGGSGTNLTAGQVTTGNLSSESVVNSLSKGVSLPADLNKVKHALCGLVRKDREAAPAAGASAGPADDGEEKRKRLRGGGGVDPSPAAPCQGRDAPGGASTAPTPPHMEKVRSISGSNNLSGKFVDVEAAYDEASPTDASCGSDTSDGAGAGQVDGNGSSAGSRRGPSSNSSACGNAAEGTDRSGSSDGSSDGEATCKNNNNNNNNENDRHHQQRDSDADAQQPKPDDQKLGRNPKQFTFNEFLPLSKDGCEKPDQTSSRLPRTASIDGEQRKEVTERGQIAFRALFERGTLPRTFSPPPPGLALGTGLSKSSCVRNLKRSLSANTLTLPPPLQAHKPHDSAFNTWQYLRGTSSASKVDRCDSAVSVPSSSSPRPTKSLEELQSSERRRNNRKGRSHSLANNWLQLAPTFDADDEERDDNDDNESADSGVDETTCNKENSFVCKLDISIAACQSEDVELDSDTTTTTTSLGGPSPPLSIHHHALSLCVGLKSSTVVKYSGLGFVPYQRACTPRVELTPVHKL